MWLINRLKPDFKTIADFRKNNKVAFVTTCRAFVQFCRAAGLIAGDLDVADKSESEQVVDRTAIKAALAKLEAKQQDNRTCQTLMKSRGLEQFNTHESDARKQLEPMAKAAKAELEQGTLTVTADMGYSNGQQFQACEEASITAYVPPNRTSNPGGETLFERKDCTYDAERDRYQCRQVGG